MLHFSDRISLLDALAPDDRARITQRWTSAMSVLNRSTIMEKLGFDLPVDRFDYGSCPFRR